jgi:hypothetical protein
MASRKNQKPTAKTTAANPTAPATAKPSTPLKPNQAIAGTWFEENWTSWLRPVVFIAIAGIFLLLYSTGALSDYRAAIIIMVALVGVVWFAAVATETERFPEDKRTALYGLSALVALFAWVAVLFSFYPGKPLLVGDLKKKGDAIDLAPLGPAQNYMIISGGTFVDETAGNRDIEYVLEGFDGTKKVTTHGRVEQKMEQVKSRRGVAGQTLKVHSQDKSYLTLDSSKPLTLLSDINTQSLPDGIHVAIYDPPLGGPWLLIGSLIFYLVLMFIDTKNVADKGKGYLAAGGGVLILGAFVFCTNAVPYAPFTESSELAQTALGAAMIGGIFGAFGGLLLAFIMGKYIQRPPLPDDFAKEEVKG